MDPEYVRTKLSKAGMAVADGKILVNAWQEFCAIYEIDANEEISPDLVTMFEDWYWKLRPTGGNFRLDSVSQR